MLDKAAIHDSDIDRFQVIVEQLELAKSLLKQNKIAQSRMAVILLDNLVDVLLYRLYTSVFREESEIIKIRRPIFSTADRKNIFKHFPEKLHGLKKLKLLSQEDIATLDIGHEYRNGIYHRDTHNPVTTRIVGILLFHSTCLLFRETYDNAISVGTTRSLEWLKPYGLQGGILNFSRTSTIISKTVLKGLGADIRNVRKAFVIDIKSRLENLEYLRSKLPFKIDEQFNDALKYAEFDYTNRWDSLSTKYREYLYYYLDNHENIKPLDAKKLRAKTRRAQTLLDKKLRREFDQFRQTISIKYLREASQYIQQISNEKSKKKLLQSYQMVDRNLTKIERAVELLTEEWDMLVQREIDRRRGK